MPTAHIFLRLPILFITFNLITALIPSALCDDDAQYTECRNTYDCGSLKNITYPFWAANSRPQHCGREGYQLTCRDDQKPVIRIEDQDFLVLDISREVCIITITRLDLWDSPCPSRLVNTTLDYDRFAYVQAVRNLTLYYGCVPHRETVPNNFTCKIEGTQKDLAFYIDDSISRLTPHQNETMCFNNISVPIMWTGVDLLHQNPTVDVLQQVLKQGFKVEYKANWELCGPCMRSNGTCGSNNTTDSFLCFCGGHPYEETCPNSGAKRTSSLDRSYEACKPQTCGNGPNISYPFWLSDRQESFCGYPSFKIACDGENPVLSISDDDYIIKDIFYSNHSFVLANAVVYRDKCPRPLHNFSLDRTPFSYSSSDHIDFSFFYNCDKEPKEYMHPYPIDCASNASHHSFAIFHKDLVEDMNYSCLSPVNLPVDVAVGVEALLQMNYTEILKMGFLLNWTAQNCRNCEKSSGRCGFKNNEFVCFCSDRPHSQSCDHDNSWNWKRKIVIGVCTAVATVLIMCVVFFVYQRRNRKQYAPSSFVSRSIFSKQTSMDDMEEGSTYLGVHLFTYRELEEATNYFDSAKELGDGGFGTVYHGNVRDGRAVAVKRLYENNCKRVEQFMNEIEILARLRHQNLVLLYVAELAFRCLQSDKDVRPSMPDVLDELKRIQSKDFDKEKAEEIDISTDDVVLLKSDPLPPPLDSLALNWISSSTTPNGSG
ncbi:hypothetical protein GBA52_017865 [Prunus armeniaca]|nr:hypothetical protein GBA52_017865 [Prunus armeniaca]